MDRLFSRLVTIIFILSCTVNAHANVSQFFDFEGNSIGAEQREKKALSSSVRRYSLPEGIQLYEDVTYEFYPVFGKTFSELVSSSEENGPYDEKEKKRSPSKIEWSVGWTYQFVHTDPLEEDGKLHVAVELYDIEFKDTITITLPTVLDSTVLNPVEKTLWENYLSKLLAREHGIVMYIRNTDSRKELLKRFEDIDYFILDTTRVVDVEERIQRLIKEDTQKIGRDWVKRIKNRK